MAATLDYNGSLMATGMVSRRAKFDGYAENTRMFNRSVLELAEVLLDTDADQTEAAKAAITELLDVEAEAKAYANALSALHSSYAPSERTSDFAQTLDKGAKRMLPIMRGADDMKEYFAEACSRLGAEEEQEEDNKAGCDDEICIGGERGAAPNAFCPLSGKPLMEIEDPVEDAKGYVYERHDVVFYIKSNHGSVKCPSTATQHMITIPELKRAHKVIRQQRQQKIYGTQKQSQADVVDVDD
ncbi:hypothetical protein ABBQ32_000083 [Trebouxia sp. C0010 RCD-2024]